MSALNRRGMCDLLFISASNIKVGCFSLLHHHYSTSPTGLQMVKYLMDSLGFSEEEALSVSAKVPPPKSTENCDLVIDLFKQNGLDQTHIRRMVSSVPKLLLYEGSKCLEPKFRLLRDLGLSTSSLVVLLTCNPSILSRSMDSHLIPSINYLKEILGCDRNLVRAITKTKWLLSFDVRRKMQPNLDLLRAKGFPDKRVVCFVIQNSNILMKEPMRFKEMVQRVEDEVGIPCNSGIFGRGIDLISSLSEHTLEMKFGVCRSFGLSNDHIYSMLRKQPLCLKLSEYKLRNGLNYFLNQVGLIPAELAEKPIFLMYSLEKRVVPRYKVLKILEEKKVLKIKLGLRSILGTTESKFFEKYVLPYKDEIPDLIETYTSQKELPLETN